MSQPQQPRRKHYEPPVPPGGVMRPRVQPIIRVLPLEVWVTVEDVATMLGVSKMTIYRLVHAKEIPATRVGQSLRIKEKDLKKFIEDNTTTNE